MKTPDWHNPQGVPESALQPGERFLLKEEVDTPEIRNFCHRWDQTTKDWITKPALGASRWSTYKTTLPLPAEYLEPDKLVIEPGNSYMTRGGSKADIEARRDCDIYCWGGKIFHDGKWIYETWSDRGQCSVFNNNGFNDLVAPWSEPEKDWTTPEAQAECRRMWAENPAMEREVYLNGKWFGVAQAYYGTVETWNCGNLYRPAQPAPKPTPEVNWSAMPAWAEWVALDSDGLWWWFSHKPENAGTSWRMPEGCWDTIPIDYAPKYTGDWKDSLAQRGGAA